MKKPSRRLEHLCHLIQNYFVLFCAVGLTCCKTSSDVSRTSNGGAAMAITGPVVGDTPEVPTPEPTVTPPPRSPPSQCLTREQYAAIGSIPPYALKPSTDPNVQSNPNGCDPCDCKNIAATVESAIALNKSPQIAAMPPVVIDDKGTTSNDDFYKKWKECAKIGNLVWEDEQNQSSGRDNEFFNCRDFSKWFRECMIRSGINDVEVIRLGCKNCSSGKTYDHAINLIRTPGVGGNPGNWCPFEPQINTVGGGTGGYTLCCNQNQAEAIRCANEHYCEGKYGYGIDVCCQSNPNLARIYTPYIKDEICRFVVEVDDVDADGNPIKVTKLKCEGPAPISCTPMTSDPKPEVPWRPSLCVQASRACLDKKPASCLDCRHENLFDCKDAPPVKESDAFNKFCKPNMIKDLTKCNSCCESLKDLRLIPNEDYSMCTEWCDFYEFKRCRVGGLESCLGCCAVSYANDPVKAKTCNDTCRHP